MTIIQRRHGSVIESDTAADEPGGRALAGAKASAPVALPSGLRWRVLVLALLGLLSLSTASARAASPLSWGAPVQIGSGTALDGVDCPSASLCIAFSGGDVLTSTDPTGGASTWTSTMVDSNGIYGLSCPTASLCVGLSGGDVVTSTDPTGGASAWTRATIPGVNYWGITDVSCPSVSLCVAINGPNLVTSTDPTGGPSAWTVTSLAAAGDDLEQVSCPSASLCVVVDNSHLEHGGASIFTSTDPTGGVGAWTVRHFNDETGGFGLGGVTCAPVSLCVAFGGGNVLTSTNLTGGSRAWIETTNDALSLGPMSCPSVTLCVSISGSDAVTSTDPAAGAASWAATTIDPYDRYDPHQLEGVSCPSQQLCIAVDAAGNELVGSAASASRGTITVHGTSANIPLHCTGIPLAHCDLALALSVTETIKGGKVIAVAATRRQPQKTTHTTITVAKANVSLPGGYSKTATLSLNAAGKRLLTRYNKLKTKLTITTSVGTVSTTTITFAQNHRGIGI